MKKLFILTAIFLAGSLIAKAQTIEDAKKYIYYEKYESAKTTLQSLIAKGDASSDTWYWLAETYLKQQNLDSASKVLLSNPNQLFQQNSFKEDPLFFIGWAHVLLDSGNTVEARRITEEVLKATKYKSADVLLAAARANVDSKNGDLTWAIELLDKAMKRDKKNAEIYATLGDAYMKAVDGGNAITYYNKALDHDELYAEAMYKKGVIYKTQNNVEIYLERFTKAYEMDSLYAPAIYELYYHYYFRDVVTANKFLTAYIRHSDPSPEHAYMVTDLYFVSKKYNEAINGATAILNTEGNDAHPRLYKLIAYSYAALGDSSAALTNMDTYFEKQDAKEFVAKDYELKAKLLEKMNPDKSLAIEWYKKALAASKEENLNLNYMKTLAELQQRLGNREREAVWREKLYTVKKSPSNLDLYKWGMALYAAENYSKADSVFAIYQEKYPDQVYGYLYRARCNALIDTTMEKGLAVPFYVKLVDVTIKDSVKNKDLLLRSYQYLGAYEATITKNYVAALSYYDKIHILNPEDDDVSKNIAILTKWVEDGKGSNDGNKATAEQAEGTN